MATVYSLICWGGKNGTAVTSINAGTDTITLNNHGLRTGTAVVPQSTVSGVTSGTTYYARSTGTNTFTLHPTLADANANTNITNLTATTVFTLKSKAVIDYMAAYPTRWGAVGSEKIFNGLTAWRTDRVTTDPAGAYDTEYCEIVGVWDDYITSQLALNIPAAEVIIWPKVDGQFTDAWHGDVVDAGYRVRFGAAFNAALLLSGVRHTIRDISLLATTQTFSYGIEVRGTFNNVIGCIVNGNNVNDTEGIRLYTGVATNIINNKVIGCKATGYNFLGYSGSASTIANNLAAKCGTGFRGTVDELRGWYYNNASIGCTTANWGTSPSSSHAVMGYNAGITTDTPWGTNSVKTLTADNSTFKDYAGNDFSPAGDSVAHTSSSPLVDAGIVVLGMDAEDAQYNTRPSYKNGSATAWDIGPVEFDWGYGTPPASGTLSGSNIVDGTRIKIADQSGGTEIENDIVSGTSKSDAYTGPNADVYIYARKGSAAPFYKPLRLSNSIVDGSMSYDLAGLQIEDIARGASYTAGVATDWTINLSTGAITHTSGTTRYSVQDLYSYHQDYSDDSATVDDNPALDGTTPTQFSLVNSGSISDADLEDLFGGSVEFQDGTLWSNLWTTDTMAAAHDVYVVQGTSKYTAYWSSGPLDVLLKVSNAGTLVSSGLVTAYARPWGYTYANYTADLSAGGRNVAPLSTLADAAITETAVTVGGWTDVVVTFGTYSLDFGDGDGAQGYKCRIDCNSRPLSEVYQRMQYLTRDVSTATLNGVEGWRYAAAHSSYTPNNAAPFGTYAGGVWSLAKGVWLDNVPSGDALNYIVTDDAGGTHQNVVALNQSVTITGPTAGSRVQIYDTTNSVELFNSTSGPYYWEDPLAPAGDRAIRVRISYVSGTTAKTFIEQNIGTCGTAANNKDVTYLASQTADSTYDSNAIDGSAVTGITFTDAATDLVNCNIAGGTVSWGTIYAAFVYWNFTATGIANDFTYISAPDPANYLLSGMKIRNTNATPLTITGGYGRDATTLTVAAAMDVTGSTGNIYPAPDHVVNNVVTVGGANIITGDIATVLAAIPSASTTATAVLSAAQTAPIYADMRSVIGTTVTGSGTESEPWGP